MSEQIRPSLPEADSVFCEEPVGGRGQVGPAIPLPGRCDSHNDSKPHSESPSERLEGKVFLRPFIVIVILKRKLLFIIALDRRRPKCHR